MEETEASRTLIDGFNDEIANRTGWTFLPSGFGFEKGTLVDDPGYGLKFKQDPGMKIGGLLFSFIWIGITYYILMESGHFAWPTSSRGIFVLLFGIVIILLGIAMCLSGRKEKGFKIDAGAFISDKESVPFDSIHAFQLLSMWMSNPKDTARYKIYQINLVLNDATRVRVMNTVYLEQARADLQRIAGYVSKKTWDMGDHITSPFTSVFPTRNQVPQPKIDVS